MSLLVTHILRGAQLLFAIISLGLGAYGASLWGGTGYTPSQTAFGIFLAIWTFLVVAYFMVIPRVAEAAAHPIIKLVVDTLTMLFWFSGFIALAVLAGALGSTGWYDQYLGEGYWWNNYYKVTAAEAGIGAIEWILFVVTTVFSAMELFNGKSARQNHVAANPEVQV